MKKLELKHIAPYLPYELNWKQGDRIFTMKGISHYALFTTTGTVYEWEQQDIIPILRPLSDLTVWITHNNLKVVVIDKLKDKMPNTPNFDWLRESSNSIKDLSETIIEFCVFDFLCQYHFDVFGLIEKGLAIDINTLSG